LLAEPACYTTFPSGGYILGKAAAGRLKARGLKAGMPDILVFFGGRCVGLELKVGNRGTSKAQNEMFMRLANAGVHVRVCWTLDDVIGALVQEGCPVCNNGIRIENGWRIVSGNRKTAGSGPPQSPQGARTQTSA
jgi:hypothetical protein